MRKTFPIKMALAYIASALGLALLAGCTPPITSGTVVDRQFVPAHGQLDFMPTWICDHFVMIPYTRHIPDAWSVTIQGTDTKGRLQERRLRITQGEFDRAVIGKPWPPAAASHSPERTDHVPQAPEPDPPRPQALQSPRLRLQSRSVYHA